MSIGITQLIVLIIIGILLFGNLPKVFKELGSGIAALKKEISPEDLTESNKEVKSKKEDTSVNSSSPVVITKEESEEKKK